MFLLHFLILSAFICGGHSEGNDQLYNHYIYKLETKHHDSFWRIIELMRAYYEEGNYRIMRLNHIRFMYEESPYYEMGYITGEIIERYRKVIKYTQNAANYNFFSVFDLIKTMELVQKLYFELYHLVRMIHETPRKYRNVTEFVEIETIAARQVLSDQGFGEGFGGFGGKIKKKYVVSKGEQSPDLFSIQQSLIEQRKNRAKQKQRQKKKLEHIRQAYFQGIKYNLKHERKPFNNTIWPRDYGWEIDFDW